MAEEKPKGKDCAVVIGKNADGTYEVIRHDENHQISFGNVKPIKDGQPISGDHEVIRESL